MESRGNWKRIAEAARRMERHPRLVRAARRGRSMLPGDSRYGDPLSTAQRRAPQVAARQLAEITAESPGVLRELGLGALQVWQELSEVQGRGRGDAEVAIVFTDLVGFSSWTLEAGDTLALELLRDVGEAIEPPIVDHGGQIVKRLGDGLMAAFADAQDSVDAVLEAGRRLGEVESGDYRPQMRAGIHLGRPRRLGGDLLGVDVNIAARLADAASAGEVLVSDRVLERIDAEGLEVKRRRRFKAKGAPKDLTAHAILG
ncbi:MAG: adenylate/guanylate cyclase domain-containing protein [Thermoleophilaceae bacterium]